MVHIKTAFIQRLFELYKLQVFLKKTQLKTVKLNKGCLLNVLASDGR